MTDKTPSTTIDEYISTFPDDTQAILEKVRQAPYDLVEKIVTLLMKEKPEKER